VILALVPSELTELRDVRSFTRYYDLGRLAAQLVNIVSRVRTDQRLVCTQYDHYFPSGAFLQLPDHAFSRILPWAVGFRLFQSTNSRPVVSSARRHLQSALSSRRR
jgi:hypothetical protein